MSRAPRFALFTFLALAGMLGPIARAHAEAPPADSLLDSYMRRMADSTSGYFGLSAAHADTAGLDSVLAVGLSLDPGETRRQRRAQRLALSPRFGFNRMDGWSLGGEAGIGASRGRGRVSAKALYTFEQEDLLGGGEYRRRWTDRVHHAAWTFELWGGRTTEPFDRDHYDAGYSTIRAVLSGADRHQYLRRDGVSTTLARESALGRLSVGYRDQYESSRPTATTWNLFGNELALATNGPAAFGRAREAAFEGELRLPGAPMRLQLQHWTAGPATNSDFTYRRTRVALGGDVGLFGHFALAPQIEWGRLRGDALPQDAFYLGGGPSVRSLDRNELLGAGKAFGRVDLLLIDDVLALIHLPHPDMFPLQIGAFAGSGAVWDTQGFSGGPRTARDWPLAQEWRSEFGASLLYRPGLPDPELFVRLDLVVPVGPAEGRETGLVISFQRTLNLLPSRTD